MRQRQAVAAEMAIRYKRRSSGSVVILNEAVKLLHYPRAYTARVLRPATAAHRRRRHTQPTQRPGRVPVYADRAFPEGSAGGVGSHGLSVWPAPGRSLAEVVAALKRHEELSLSPEVRDKRLRISDRWPKIDRKRMGIADRSGTTPGSLLKGAIPVKETMRCTARWFHARPLQPVAACTRNRSAGSILIYYHRHSITTGEGGVAWPTAEAGGIRRPRRDLMMTREAREGPRNDPEALTRYAD